MPNGKSYNRSRTVKLDKEEDAHLQHHCSKLGVDVSSFIRQAITEKLSDVHPAHVAGNNRIEYDRKKDNFAWRVVLDTGEEKTVMEEVSKEFIEDLFNECKKGIHERALLTGKDVGNGDSVSVPRRLVG